MATAPERKPWKNGDPRKRDGASRPLSPGRKRDARARARKAGRRYPNLVDNMAVARTTGGDATKPKQTAR